MPEPAANVSPSELLSALIVFCPLTKMCLNAFWATAVLSIVSVLVPALIVAVISFPPVIVNTSFVFAADAVLVPSVSLTNELVCVAPLTSAFASALL